MKTGRGREYSYTPDTARYGPYANLVCQLDEQLSRLADLIDDIPDEAGNAVPEWGENSAWWLSLHMSLAEASWIARFNDKEGPNPFPPHGTLIAQTDILDSFTETRNATKSYLADLHQGTACVALAGPFTSVEHLLTHLVWHWVYHTGQVGLMRRYLGHRYKWTFAH